VIKPPSLVPLATIGVPTLGMVLLFLLPFFDRGPERRPERRPIAAATFVVVAGAMAFLTYQGANAGSPLAVEMPTPKAVAQAGGATLAEYNVGKAVVAASGCLACHKLGDNGNAGPGPDLTRIASRLPRQGLARTLVNPAAPMPSFKNLPPRKFQALVAFLSQLK
jgi:mono/diheme cytochrome c family protein